MRSRLPAHRHRHGHWCHCPFGNKEPYVSPADREVYGHVEARWVEADKMNDFLRPRPDLQAPEHQRFLDRLELAYPNHDALYPFLVRERKKGRVNDPYEAAANLYWPVAHDYFDPSSSWSESEPIHFHAPLHFTDHEGYNRVLDEDTLDQINDWMKYQKQAGKGIDIMKHEIGPAVDAAQKADIGGEVVHEFDNGYKVVKLRNKRDMVTEGQRMHHCVGSNGMGYIEKNRDGEGLFYSLRDSRNEPYGTAEVSKSQDEYHKCPECGKFALGKYQYSPETGGYTGCEHCGHDISQDERTKTFPMNLNGKTHPDAAFTEISQMFGPHDHKMDDYHEEMFNDYFAQHGHDYYNSDGEEEEEEEYEPWWDEYYMVPGARNAEEYLDHTNGDYHEYAPEEYDRAVRDAHDHDLEGSEPELEVEDPDYDDVFEDLKGRDPEVINRVFQSAADNGGNHLDEFLERANQWLEDDYTPYLDPYGQTEGPGYFPSHPRGTAPELPGSHYPETYPEEMYLARNLLYQIDKHMPTDPQTGERKYDYQLHHLYPILYPHNSDPRGSQAPTMRDEPTPVTEETGPLYVQRPNPQPHGYPRTINTELPYGRDDVVYHPDANMNDPLSTPEDQTWTHPSPHPRFPDPHRFPAQSESEPFVPKGLSTPEQYFAPGEETTVQHQRAFPGMEFDRGEYTDMMDPDTHREPPRPSTPYNPNEPYMFPQGQQQGKLFPGGWYIDYQKQRAQKTELPQELFPPDKYGYHMPQSSFQNFEQPGQMPMWEQSMMPGSSYLNTQTEPGTQDNPVTPPHVDVGAGRPLMEWRAKTAGPWTNIEEKGGKPRPKSDRNEGFGRFDVPVHHGKPHLNGRLIEHHHPNPFTLPGHEWRRPVVYDKTEDRLYVGQKGMEHADMMNHFHKPNPWGPDFDAGGDYIPGFIDTEGNIEGGGLQFFKSDEIPNEEEFHDWVEGQHGVRASDSEFKDPFDDLSWEPDDDDKLHEATYHPRENEEWAADDEPVFSAIIPEGRWQI